MPRPTRSPCSGRSSSCRSCCSRCPAGAWVDRLPRRLILVVGDFGRAVSLVSIPIAYELGVLTIWQLYIVGFVNGTLTVFFDVADQSFLPAILEPRRPGRGQLEAPGQRVRGADPRPAARRRSRRAADRADRGPARRRELRRVGRPDLLDPEARAETRSRKERRRPTARRARSPASGPRSPRACATSSATRTCATSPRAPARRTCSRTSRSRPSRSSPTGPSS